MTSRRPARSSALALDGIGPSRTEHDIGEPAGCTRVHLGELGLQWHTSGRPGMDDVIEQCRRYAEILGGTLEIDVRLVDQDDEAA